MLFLSSESHYKTVGGIFCWWQKGDSHVTEPVPTWTSYQGTLLHKKQAGQAGSGHWPDWLATLLPRLLLKHFTGMLCRTMCGYCLIEEKKC